LATLAADQARWQLAETRLQEALKQVGTASPMLAREFALIAASVKLIDRPGQLVERDFMTLANTQLAALEQPHNAKAKDDAFMALVAAYLGQRAGYSSVATKVLKELSRWEKPLSDSIFNKMLAVVQAENERLAGHPDAAIRRLENEIGGAELVQTRVAMLTALSAAGRNKEALKQADWLIEHRGRAYIEANAAQVLQTLNVIDTRIAVLQAAEAMMALQETGPAAEKLDAFLDAWPRNRLPVHLRLRADAILPASKQ
jgi:hypothetical protein